MIKKILVVDDEPHILRSLKELLELEDKVVDTAENGSAALDKLHDTHYDLIISDAKMPVLNGQEFLKKLRKSNNNIKFIILTGESDFSQKKLKELGADAVFYKPLDFDILIESISAI